MARRCGHPVCTGAPYSNEPYATLPSGCTCSGFLLLSRGLSGEPAAPDCHAGRRRSISRAFPAFPRRSCAGRNPRSPENYEMPDSPRPLGGRGTGGEGCTSGEAPFCPSPVDFTFVTSARCANDSHLHTLSLDAGTAGRVEQRGGGLKKAQRGSPKGADEPL